MESNREDRRVVKTKLLLREEFSKLLLTKSINRITVKELAERANINRATFYAHYKDVYDLFESIETEGLQNFERLLSAHKIEDRMLDIKPLLTDVFEYIGENAGISYALLCSHGDIAYVKRVQAMLGDYFILHWRKFNPEDTSRFGQYTFAFVLSGCTGLLQKWLEEGMPQQPREMAEIATKLVRNGLVNLMSGE